MIIREKVQSSYCGNKFERLEGMIYRTNLALKEISENFDKFFPGKKHKEGR